MQRLPTSLAKHCIQILPEQLEKSQEETESHVVVVNEQGTRMTKS